MKERRNSLLRPSKAIVRAGRPPLAGASGRPSSVGRSSSGFTLLEVLVGLALIGTAVVAVLEVASANLRSISSAEEYVRATMRAEARMREIVADDGLSERSWSETTPDGYRLDGAVSRILDERTQTAGVGLLRIELSIQWPAGTKMRKVQFQTLKLVGARRGDKRAEAGL